MPEFKYLGYEPNKNKRHFISQRAFLFRYVGENRVQGEIIKELGSLFASQSFTPFELVSFEDRYALHVLARHKNIRIPIHIANYHRAITKDLYYISVSYGNLGSKFEDERSKLEDILEKACKSVSGKV
ncbi:MAG: hypothetical protein ABIH63_02765 [archaeon]